MSSLSLSATPCAERRYFAEPLSWLTHHGSILAINQIRPGWAVLNETAAWIIRFCEVAEGRTLAQITQHFRGQFGGVSNQEISRWLVDLEAGGLLVSTAELPKLRTLVPPSYDSYRVEHVYIELLARCNLRCIHCYMEGAPGREERLESEEVLAVLEAFKREGGQYVTLAGGEPLIYPDFPYIARSVSQLGLCGTVITNGIPLRDKHLALLNDLGFNLAISLDGISAEVHETIRGKRTYPLVISAIDRVLNTLGPDRFILSFTPVKANLDDLPALFDFVEEKGIRRVNLSLFEEVGRATAHYDCLHLTELDRMRIISIVYRKALDLIGKVEVDFNDTRNILSRFSTDQQPQELHPLWRGVRLTSQGDVYPSSFGSSEEYRLGNIRETSFSQLLRSEVLRQLYESLFDRFQTIPKCNGCVWRQICRGGSVTSSYYATGHIFAPDSYCEGYLKLFPEVAVRLAQLAAAESR